jgi:hypothetical protein
MNKGPNAYAILRQQAVAKMDKAIKEARDEYRETLYKINALQDELVANRPRAGKLKTQGSIFALVIKHIPTDRPFTASELCDMLEAVYPDRPIKKQTVKSGLHKLGERGIIRRISKEKDGFIIWAHHECGVTAPAWAAMPMSKVIAEALKARPMRIAEVVIAVQSLGYRENDDPSELLRTVRKALYNNPRKFARNEAEQWSLVPQCGN